MNIYECSLKHTKYKMTSKVTIVLLMSLPPESASRVVRELCEGAVVSQLRCIHPVVGYRCPWTHHLGRVDYWGDISLIWEGSANVIGWYRILGTGGRGGL